MSAEKQIYIDAWMYESEVNLALMGLRLRKYIEIGGSRNFFCLSGK